MLCMLAWLGIDSSWDRRSFWSNENLFASFFYGGDAIGAGFSARTMPGLALYLIVYSALGCVFAAAVGTRLRPGRTFLAAIVFALGWFYLSFHVLWKSAMPLVYLLYADRPMVVGHLIYGACLGLFPSFLPGAKARAAARDRHPEAAEPLVLAETRQNAPPQDSSAGGPGEPIPPSS